MTDLRKPISRRSNTYIKDRALIIELRPGAIDTIFIREAGRRSGYTVPVARVYALGARLEAEAKRAEQAAKKKARKAV